ncbi:MAG: Beta-barrel assembly-enhancing protease [Gammaproteobacteria bacterium]|nr:MAG: Beta-barrel assembly-enhancing protease [Gammaproteobacteria bacterium]
MRIYLSVLLIIIPFFIGSCSKQQEDDSNSYNLNMSVGDRSSYLYQSIYINFALTRSLEDEALSMFIENIDNMTEQKLFEKISKISLETYQYDKSEIIANRWLQIYPKSYNAYQFSISSSLENNNLLKAEKYFIEYLKIIKPIDKNDYSKLIFSFLDNKNRLNVVNFFENYLTKNDNRALNLNFIELLYSYNMPSKVIKHIDKLGTFGERNLVRLYASSHMLLKSYNKSQNILESYLKGKKASDRQVQFELLEIYILNNQKEYRDKLIQKILDSDPDNLDTIYQISRILFESSMFDLSEKYLSSIVVESDEVNLLRGMIDYERGSYIEAIDHFDRITNYNYKILAIINKSSAMSKLESVSKAIDYLENLKKNYNDSSVRQRFALKQISLLNEKKLYKDIITLTNKILDNNNDNINILYARAMAYESLDNINLMEKDLKQVLKYDRKNANTLNALGYSLTIHTERYEEAYNFIHQAYHYDPGSPAILDSLAWILYKKGEFTHALIYAESSYIKDQDPEIVEHYCIILMENKLYEKLKEVIKKESVRNSNNENFIKKLHSIKDEIPL